MEKQIHHSAPQSCIFSRLPSRILSACQTCNLGEFLTRSSPSSPKCIQSLRLIEFLPGGCLASSLFFPLLPTYSRFHLLSSCSWGLQPSLHTTPTCIFIIVSAKRWLGWNLTPSVISNSPSSLNKQTIWVTTVCLLYRVQFSCTTFQTNRHCPSFFYGNFGGRPVLYCPLSVPDSELPPFLHSECPVISWSIPH